MAEQSSTGGIGFCGLLAILFIGLKLTHYIDWSWLWVLAPIWIPIAFGLGIMAVAAVVFVFLWFVGGRSLRRY